MVRIELQIRILFKFMLNFNKNNCEFIFRNLDSMSICQHTHWEEIAK